MKKLKTLLQSNYFYVLLLIFIVIYIFIGLVIKNDENYLTTKELTGTVTNLQIKDGYITFILKAKEKVYCTYYLSDEEVIDITNLNGKKITITDEYSDLINNTIPNTFNFKKYLAHNYIYNKFKVSNITIIKNENILYKIKNLLSNKINSYEDNIKSYLNIFILGNKSDLDSEYYNIYQGNGIWHLFAISGMHICLIILFLNKILKRIKIKDVIIILFLLFFMFLTNFSASVLRCSIFYFLSVVLKKLNISLSGVKILILTSVIILLFNPFMIYNTGFQYSFLITLGILLESKNIMGSYFIKILKISLIAFLVSLPITVSLNYEVNFLSILLNLLYVPFISYIIFPLSILTFIFKFLSPIMSFFVNILEMTNTLFSNISLNLIIPKMNYILIIIYYLGLLLFRENKKILLLFVSCIVFINIVLPKLDKNYYVYFLDVGQGDSSILISPYKKEVIMIDTGGSTYSDYHVSDNTILFLKSLGISKIDLLIITHGDADHANEALNIIANFNVKNIILNNGEINSLESSIKEVGNIVTAYESKYFDYTLINDYFNDDENYSSIITHINIYDNNFLFMGDSPSEVEKLLIKDYDLKVDVLKLGHHGSKTSSSEIFLKNYDLSYAIISSGRNNIYNHPSKEVIDRLESLNIDYLNTQTSGTIEFKINEKSYTIIEYKP